MLPARLSVRDIDHATGDLRDFEIVECKGLGHPDTICDGIAEELSLTLSRRYLEACGRVLHHNVDKVLLAGGASSPRFGGGEVSRPMELFLAGRATAAVDGVEIPIEELARQAANRWVATHLPTIDQERHVKVHSLVRPGSAELTNLFARNAGRTRFSNDTSCGVGYAPLSRLETIVYAVERDLRAVAAASHPEFGRDIKVMGLRRGGHFHLTIACALVSRFVSSLSEYLDAKKTIAAMARQIVRRNGAPDVAVDVNAADTPDTGSIYLTVTGTSAEAGDDGEAGRGNRINGLITPFRPMTMESVAGKNPVTHVGKLYNIVASLVAQRLVDEVAGVGEAQCFIVSQIGSPLDQPQAVEVSVRAPSAPARALAEIAEIVDDELSRLGSIADELLKGTLAIGRCPLRTPGAQR